MDETVRGVHHAIDSRLYNVVCVCTSADNAQSPSDVFDLNHTVRDYTPVKAYDSSGKHRVYQTAAVLHSECHRCTTATPGEYNCSKQNSPQLINNVSHSKQRPAASAPLKAGFNIEIVSAHAVSERQSIKHLLLHFMNLPSRQRRWHHKRKLAFKAKARFGVIVISETLVRTIRHYLDEGITTP